eukprot:CAMPEP_0185830532 /NCGR_PEP_ID=MMETSP1353-20130828/909_1 /TAXON_ID=1077150 /ORGANISM="Erythrolobus australicus, Strain CCMP3124" /LENGTH=500 /DNA_ID=CAMNT_0028528451 /DNA_START=246 /DNA_END=1748 /DNA_ORIENTATION=-
MPTDDTVLAVGDDEGFLCEKMRCTASSATGVMTGKLGVIMVAVLLGLVLLTGGGSVLMSSLSANPFLAEADPDFGVELRRMEALSFPFETDPRQFNPQKSQEFHDGDKAVTKQTQTSTDAQSARVLQLLPLDDPAESESELDRAKRALNEVNSELLRTKSAVQESLRALHEQRAQDADAHWNSDSDDMMSLIEQLGRHLDELENELVGSHRRQVLEEVLLSVLEPAKRTLDFWQYPEFVKHSVEGLERAIRRAIEDLHYFRSEDAVLITRCTLLGIACSMVCVVAMSMLLVGKNAPWEVLASINVLNAWALFQMFVAKVVFQNDVIIHAYHHHRFALGLLQAAAVLQLPIMACSIASFIVCCKRRSDTLGYRLSIAYAVQYVFYAIVLVHAAESMYRCRSTTICKLSVPVLSLMLVSQGAMLMTLVFISLPRLAPKDSGTEYFERDNSSRHGSEHKIPFGGLSRVSSVTEELIIASAYSLEPDSDSPRLKPVERKPQRSS